MLREEERTHESPSLAENESGSNVKPPFPTLTSITSANTAVARPKSVMSWEYIMIVVDVRLLIFEVVVVL